MKADVNLNDGSVSPFVNDIPESEALKILIVTRGRSGSSFLGDLLNSYPGTFYSYEPLRTKKEKKFSVPVPHKNDSERNKSIETIQNSFKCKPPEIDKRGCMKCNYHYWNIFKDMAENEKVEQYQKFYSSACTVFPIRLVKTIRFGFEYTESLLLDPQIGNKLKVIFLFRDPRGIYQSYVSKVNWCNEMDKTSGLCNITTFCNLIHDDVQEAMNIQKRYPGK